MVSHVEQAIAARVAAVRARKEQRAIDRAAFAEKRVHGLQDRHAAKLRRLDPAASGLGQPRALEDRAALTGQTVGMTDDNVIPREQAIRNARVALDRGRARRDADRAAGRLAPEIELIMQRLEREQRGREAVRPIRISPHRAAAIEQRGDETEQPPRGDANE